MTSNCHDAIRIRRSNWERRSTVGRYTQYGRTQIRLATWHLHEIGKQRQPFKLTFGRAVQAHDGRPSKIFPLLVRASTFIQPRPSLSLLAKMNMAVISTTSRNWRSGVHWFLNLKLFVALGHVTPTNMVNSQHHGLIIHVSSFRTDDWYWLVAPFDAEGLGAKHT